MLKQTGIKIKVFIYLTKINLNLIANGIIYNVYITLHKMLMIKDTKFFIIFFVMIVIL